MVGLARGGEGGGGGSRGRRGVAEAIGTALGASRRAIDAALANAEIDLPAIASRLGAFRAELRRLSDLRVERPARAKDVGRQLSRIGSSTVSLELDGRRRPSSELDSWSNMQGGPGDAVAWLEAVHASGDAPMERSHLHVRTDAGEAAGYVRTAEYTRVLSLARKAGVVADAVRSDPERVTLWAQKRCIAAVPYHPVRDAVPLEICMPTDL